MRFSRELLVREAQLMRFRPEILEKVFQLLHLLTSFLSHPYLRDRIVLKGGTALNLFHFDVPRLSVDECRQALLALFPLSDKEIEFLTQINELGQISPHLLTADRGLQKIITRQPLLKWKAQNVREYIRGRSRE